MHLDTNFWKVKQENFRAAVGTDTDIQEAILKENGDTFKNTPIHLIFYEKINK